MPNNKKRNTIIALNYQKMNQIKKNKSAFDTNKDIEILENIDKKSDVLTINNDENIKIFKKIILDNIDEKKYDTPTINNDKNNIDNEPIQYILIPDMYSYYENQFNYIIDNIVKSHDNNKNIIIRCDKHIYYIISDEFNIDQYKCDKCEIEYNLISITGKIIIDDKKSDFVGTIDANEMLCKCKYENKYDDYQTKFDKNNIPTLVLKCFTNDNDDINIKISQNNLFLET